MLKNDFNFIKQWSKYFVNLFLFFFFLRKKVMQNLDGKNIIRENEI